MSFAERARKVINENQELLIALEELDRTGKVSKLNYKKRANFTIDEELLRKFKQYCREKRIKMSNKVEELMMKGLENS